MSLSADELRELAKFVLLTKPDEIGCDDWLGYAPSYAELVAASQPVPEPLRKAAEHLDAVPGMCRGVPRAARDPYRRRPQADRAG